MNDRKEFPEDRAVRRLGLASALGLLLMLSAGSLPAEEVQSADQTASRIEKLIAQLGDEDYFVRERAQAELAKYSFEAFRPLSEAAKDENLEIASRAKFLLQLMRLHWTTDDDPADVKRLLADFEAISVFERRARIKELAELPDAQGVAALCRLARYHSLPLIQQSAAAALLAEIPFGEPPTDELAALIRKHVGSNPDPKSAADWLVTFLHFADDPTEALKEWTKLVESEHARVKREDDEEALPSVAVLVRHEFAWHKKLGQREQAVKSILRLIALEKNDPELLSKRLIWLVREKEFDIFDHTLLGLGSAFAKDPLLLYDVAQVLREASEPERAKSAATLALKATPDNGRKDDDRHLSRHYQIAVELQQRGQIDWARLEYRHVIASGKPGSEIVAYTQYTLSELLHDQGLDFEAAKVLEKLVVATRSKYRIRVPGLTGIAGTRARMHYFASCHWAKEGNQAKQRESLERALEADKTDVDVLIACYRLPDQTPEFRQRISDLIKESAKQLAAKAAAQPEIPTYYNQYAWLIGNTEGDMDKALEFSKKSLELAPDSGGYLDTLAHVYFGRGEYEKAVETQKKAVELEPHMKMLAEKLEVFQKKLEEEKAKGTGESAQKEAEGE